MHYFYYSHLISIVYTWPFYQTKPEHAKEEVLKRIVKGGLSVTHSINFF
jgi:hypothetical protein